MELDKLNMLTIKDKEKKVNGCCKVQPFSSEVKSSLIIHDSAYIVEC